MFREFSRENEKRHSLAYVCAEHFSGVSYPFSPPTFIKIPWVKERGQ